MYAKFMRIVLLGFIGSILLCLPVANAQEVIEPETMLWGLWSTMKIDDIESQAAGHITMAFYPDGTFYMPGFEGYSVGTYTIDDHGININATSFINGIQSPYVASFGYMITDEWLMLMSDEHGPADLGKFATYQETGSLPCADAMPSQMRSSYFGRVTYTDGTATRMRANPSTSSPVVDEMPEGSTFIVIGGPVCAEGYTWWNIWQGYNNVGWAAEGKDYYFIEPDPMVFQHTQTPLPVPSESIVGIWEGSMEYWAFYPDGRVYLYDVTNTSNILTGRYLLEQSTVVVTQQNASGNTWSDRYAYEVHNGNLFLTHAEIGINRSYTKITDLNADQIIPGSTYVPLSVYSRAQEFGEALGSGEATKYLADKIANVVDIHNHIINIWEFELPGHGAVEVACTGDDLYGLFKGSTDPNLVKIACVIHDSAELGKKAGPIVGSLYFLTQAVGNPELFIDSWLDGVNQYASSCPLSTWLAGKMGLPPPPGCHT